MLQVNANISMVFVCVFAHLVGTTRATTTTSESVRDINLYLLVILVNLYKMFENDSNQQ